MIDSASTPRYRYLAHGGSWPGVRLYGATIEDGAICLPRVPAAATDVHAIEQTEIQIAGAARIGVAADGTIYIADPAHHRILRVDCAGGRGALTCGTTAGDSPGEFNGPRGVVVGPRGLVYVADTGNHRVQLLDGATGQVIAVWGQPDPWNTPLPSLDDGRFDSPWDLASDGAGNVYVAEPGREDARGRRRDGRIQKFDCSGRVDAAFWKHVHEQRPRPGSPAAIAIILSLSAHADRERLLVLDAQPSRILVYRLDGTLDEAETDRWENVAAILGARGLGADPVDVAWSERTLYVADASHARVLIFDASGNFVASVASPGGTLAGIAIDAQGRLLAHPGGRGSVARFDAGGRFADHGMFVVGPIDVGHDPTRWFSVSIDQQRGDDAHVRLFTFASNGAVGPDESGPTLDELAARPDDLRSEVAALDEWRATPADSSRVLVLNAPARYLWIAAVLRSGGGSTPSLRQLRVDFDHEGWIRQLPAIYASDVEQRPFLERVLALFESMLDDDQRLIDDLPLLFDASASPLGDARSSWLTWLAHWLDLELDESWSETQCRDAVREAFALFGWRGTPEGITRLIRMYTGATARLSEPARDAHPWVLGESSPLGAGTMLAAAEAQGAVLGTTATLDHSHLLRDENYGAPLFDATAHRFTIELYAAQLRDRRDVDRVRVVLDREKPAHTDYHLCVIEPRMRVGFQARLGIDAIVGGPPGAMLDDERKLGIDTMTATSGRTALVGAGARVSGGLILS